MLLLLIPHCVYAWKSNNIAQRQCYLLVLVTQVKHNVGIQVKINHVSGQPTTPVLHRCIYFTWALATQMMQTYIETWFKKALNITATDMANEQMTQTHTLVRFYHHFLLHQNTLGIKKYLNKKRVCYKNQIVTLSSQFLVQ